jgi:hypothetical protein
MGNSSACNSKVLSIINFENILHNRPPILEIKEVMAVAMKVLLEVVMGRFSTRGCDVAKMGMFGGKSFSPLMPLWIFLLQVFEKPWLIRVFLP